MNSLPQDLVDFIFEYSPFRPLSHSLDASLRYKINRISKKFNVTNNEVNPKDVTFLFGYTLEERKEYSIIHYYTETALNNCVDCATFYEDLISKISPDMNATCKLYIEHLMSGKPDNLTFRKAIDPKIVIERNAVANRDVDFNIFDPNYYNRDTFYYVFLTRMFIDIDREHFVYERTYNAMRYENIASDVFKLILYRASNNIERQAEILCYIFATNPELALEYKIINNLLYVIYKYNKFIWEQLNKKCYSMTELMERKPVLKKYLLTPESMKAYKEHVNKWENSIKTCFTFLTSSNFSDHMKLYIRKFPFNNMDCVDMNFINYIRKHVTNYGCFHINMIRIMFRLDATIDDLTYLYNLVVEPFYGSMKYFHNKQEYFDYALGLVYAAFHYEINRKGARNIDEIKEILRCSNILEQVLSAEYQ